MRHKDCPHNFHKILNRIPKRHVFLKYVEAAALLNIQSNYSMWPSFIFAPIFVWCNAMALSFPDMQENPGQLVINAEEMHSLAGFRYTKDIYYFDEDLIYNLTNTKMSDINANALLRLPEQHLYVELNGKLKIGEKSVLGFYAYYNDEVGHERLHRFEHLDPEVKPLFEKYPYSISFRILWHDNEKDNIFMGSIPLIDGKINDVILHIKNIRDAVKGHQGIYYNENTGTQERIKILSKILPILLYLCSDEPDIKDKKSPKIKHVAYYDKDKPKKVFSPSITRTWLVGHQIGKKLRGHRAEWHGRSAITPHLRRAHWHGFYKGKRNSNERELIYKWIPPIFVTPNEDKNVIT